MGESFTGIDLIVLMVTLAIGYRIYTILGKRTGNEKDLNTVPEEGVGMTVDAVDEPVVLTPAIAKIREKDKSFTEAGFIEGAKKAFEMIIEAFTAGDESTLKPLLSKGLFAEFKEIIQTRTQNKQAAELLYFRIVSAEVLESELEKNKAIIKVKFMSEQTLVVKEGETLVEGNPDLVDEVIDIWSFERSYNSKSPNWILTHIQPWEEGGE